MKVIAVAQSWGLFEVPDDTWEVLANGALKDPPAIVLEVMVMNGTARKVGSIGSFTVGHESDGEGEIDDGNILPEDPSDIFDEDTEDDES